MKAFPQHRVPARVFDMRRHLSFVDSITSASPTTYTLHAIAVLSLKHSPSPPNTKIGAYVLLSAYFFMYEMPIFSLSILKENFNLVEVAHTGKRSLPIANTDSPFSTSTDFLGVLQPSWSHGKLSLWCFILEFPILYKGCHHCHFWKPAPPSHIALYPKHTVTGYSPFPTQRSPLRSSFSWEIPRDRKKSENKSFHSLRLHHFQEVCSGFDLLISRP